MCVCVRAQAVASSLFFAFLGLAIGDAVVAQLIGSFYALIAMIFSGYLLQARLTRVALTSTEEGGREGGKGGKEGGRAGGREGEKGE